MCGGTFHYSGGDTVEATVMSQWDNFSDLYITQWTVALSSDTCGLQCRSIICLQPLIKDRFGAVTKDGHKSECNCEAIK